MKREVQNLEKQIQSLNSQIVKFPKGNLVYSRTGKYVKWYVSYEGKKEYIPKKNIEYIQKMAAKKYLILLKDDLIKEKEVIELCLKVQQTKSRQAESLLGEESVYREFLSPLFQPKSKELQEWMNEPYEKNQKHPENLIHKTSLGICVRSKSEALIATYLHINKIPFRYECKLILGNQVYYPDFMIRHPKTGEYFYWEHFGKMDEPQYCRKTASKIQTYSLNGIIPTIHLITTYETKDNPLTTDVIQKIIEHYFLE